MKKGERVSILSSDDIKKIYQIYCFIFSKGLANYSYAYEYEIRKRHVNHSNGFEELTSWDLRYG